MMETDERQQLIKENARARKKKRTLITAVTVLVVAALIGIGVFLFVRYRVFSSYSTTMSWKIPNTAENVKYFNFDEGWIKTS
ncbi:MAG: hypothetical protein HUJ75_03470, partial [Parasporobacterium sp.]|nr:hypothetical protein [Parasporobacterium sp.]